MRLVFLTLSIVFFVLAALLPPSPRVRFEWLGFALYVAAQVNIP